MRVRMMSAEKTSGAARISMIIAIFVLMMAVQMFRQQGICRRAPLYKG